MKTSQLKTIFSFLLLAAMSFSSCKKDDPAPKDPIAGSWVGKYGYGNDVPETFYSFVILPNGLWQIRADDKSILGTGTWKLEGINFSGVYTYTLGGTYNVVAKYDAAAGTISGSWGSGASGPAEGAFYLNKE